MEENKQSEISPMNYLKIFFRRKELFIIPVFFGLVIGICSGMVMPKKYVSSTILLVEEGKSDNPLFAQLAVSTTVKQRMSTIRESMMGWNSLVKLVKRLEMDKNISTPRQLEGLILGIRKNIDIRLRGRNIINLSYFGDEPEQTQSIVKNIAEIFIERNVELQNQETSDAIIFIEEQLKVYRGKIKSAEIASLQDSLDNLLVDSTEAHPQVKMFREQIASKKEDLKKENLEFTENITMDSTSNPIIDEIKSALNTIEGGLTGPDQSPSAEKGIYTSMLMDKMDTVVARDLNVNNRIYNMLLERIETAKITRRLQSSKEGTRYTVLDPPRIPLDPVKPNKLLVALTGLLVGVFVGFGLVVSCEFLDKSFIDVEDVKHFIGTPLLGAISKINTEINVKKEREHISWLYSLSALGGVTLIVVTAVIANFMK